MPAAPAPSVKKVPLAVAADQKNDAANVDTEMLYQQVRQLKRGEERNRKVKLLASRGVDAIKVMERSLSDPAWTPKFFGPTKQTLEAINSTESRTLLRRMARGEFTRLQVVERELAANAILKQDPQVAWEFLASSDPLLITAALVYFPKGAIPEQHVPVVRKLVTDDKGNVEFKAIERLLESPHGSAGRKSGVEALAEVLAATEKMPGGNDLIPSLVPSTKAEECYASCLFYLYYINPDKADLHNLKGKLTGRARDCVIIALGELRDKSVRDELIKIVTAPPIDRTRGLAVIALARIAEPEDIPLIRQMAKSDPLKRTNPMGATVYPVRTNAAFALEVYDYRIKSEKKQQQKQVPDKKAS